MPTINVKSDAESIKAQGVGSSYKEQVSLIKKNLNNKYDIFINSKKKCDITHYHTINFPFFLHLITNKKKQASVGYVHFLPSTIDGSVYLPKPIQYIFYKYIILFYKNMNYLVTVNPCFIDKLEEYDIPRDKIIYIPNYVSSDEFYELDINDKYKIRDKYNIPRDKFVVLGVGQIQTRKGILDFIEVSKKMPDVQFLWAGGFSFGKITDGYKPLKEIVDNPPENVKFLGIIDRSEMNELFNMSNLMFLPSYNELFPMSILEAMCTKTPLLLRDIDIYPSILFDYYLKDLTVDGYVDKINMLKNDESAYKYWRSKSWEGHNFYSKNSIVKMWEDFYDKVYDELSEKNLNYDFKYRD